MIVSPSIYIQAATQYIGRCMVKLNFATIQRDPYLQKKNEKKKKKKRFPFVDFKSCKKKKMVENYTSFSLSNPTFPTSNRVLLVLLSASSLLSAVFFEQSKSLSNNISNLIDRA